MFTQTQGEVTNIKVVKVGPIGANKKGVNFFMVNDNHKTGWYCEKIAIYDAFVEGSEVACITRTQPSPRGFFHTILDLAKDGTKAEDSNAEGNTTTIEYDKDKPNWPEIRQERASGLAKGAAFNKSVDIVIAFYNKGEVNRADLTATLRNVFAELKEINGE